MTTHSTETSCKGGKAARGLADWLCLAAAPAFAVMALLTGVLGGGQRRCFARP